MTDAAITCLEDWLQKRLTPDHHQWLQNQLQKILTANSDRELHITLGLIPRKFGRTDLNLTDEELNQAARARKNWVPAHWTIDTTARIYVLLQLASRDTDKFGDTLVDLCRNADLAEAIALYSGVALYPESESIDKQIGEGLRTNMRAVFEAIAHNNPYPAEHFDENRWNHMVLKALFIDSTLAPIQGLDERANAELAAILCDYAHERWAAGRVVTPELWRCVGPFATGTMVDDLERAASSSAVGEKHAALLALTQCKDPKAAEILKNHADIASAIAYGRITWDALDL
ncbi:hypothetical protein AB833_27520 [Chromatiales bacterium (ex Bugula neritina AB1)]|nr:hypothetical protein AB833_27520 [Chromatiales bacterium (ex Bugula neritina AB1)]